MKLVIKNVLSQENTVLFGIIHQVYKISNSSSYNSLFLIESSCFNKQKFIKTSQVIFLKLINIDTTLDGKL